MTPLPQMGPLAYPACRNAWRDIRVGSGLALIVLVTGSLISPQKASLMGCTVSPLVSPGLSHYFSDVGLLSVTLGRLAEGGVCCSSLILKLQKYKDVGYLPRISLKNSWVHEIAHPNHTL